MKGRSRLPKGRVRRKDKLPPIPDEVPILPSAGSGQPTKEKWAIIQKRAEEMVRLRVVGYTVTQIANKYGVTQQRASEIINKELDKTHKEEPADKLRAIESERLDRLLRALEEGIESGSPKAIAVATSISARMARLRGLDIESQPVEHEALGPAVSVTANGATIVLDGKNSIDRVRLALGLDEAKGVTGEKEGNEEGRKEEQATEEKDDE